MNKFNSLSSNEVLEKLRADNPHDSDKDICDMIVALTCKLFSANLFLCVDDVILRAYQRMSEGNQKAFAPKMDLFLEECFKESVKCGQFYRYLRKVQGLLHSVVCDKVLNKNLGKSIEF